MHNRIDKIVDHLKIKIIGHRRIFHRYPETAWTEFRTASKIAEVLSDAGYHVLCGKKVLNEKSRMGVPSKNILDAEYKRAEEQKASNRFLHRFTDGFTGVAGILDFGNKGNTIAMRFDIDAMDISEANTASHFPFTNGFRSINENKMHACGHDGHAAIGLGVAESLKQIKDDIFNKIKALHKTGGRIKLIFQPAEEGVRGAQAMVDSGLLDDVDYLLGAHIGMKADRSRVLYCGTGGFLATSKFDALFTGVSSPSGSKAEKGNNAMLAAASAVLNLHAIPRHSEGITRINVGKLTSGTVRDKVPQEAYMEIETMGSTSEIDDYMRGYAKRIIKNAAKMHDVKFKIKTMGSAISAESDNDLMKIISRIAKKSGYYNRVIDEKIEFGVSEDFTFMMERIKENGGSSSYMLFGSDLKGLHHTPEFDFNEEDLIPAVKILTLLAYELI
jgi:aminobenzoyl-glutamate utilization protein A